jgi:hypothetical protein
MIGRVLAGAILVALLCGAAAPKSERDARIEDLDFAAREYVGKSLGFTPEARAKALAHIGRLKAQAAALTKAEFLAGLYAVAAFANNPHDQVDLGGENSWFPETRMPFRLVWFNDGLVIVRGKSPELAGARITAIDGMTLAQIEERLRVHGGGPVRYQHWNLGWVLAVPELAHAMGMSKSPHRMTLDLILADGRRVQRTVEAVPASAAPRGQRPHRFWSAQPYEGEAEHGWTQAGAASKSLLYLGDPDSFFRMQKLPQLEALYVQFRVNTDQGDDKIAPFVANVRKAIETSPPQNLILDLRFDTGGDITKTRELARVMAVKVPGRIYVLIGPYTFSAGLVMAAAVKHDAGARVTVIGAPAGDELRFWSEGRPVCLPNSGYCFQVTDGVWDLAKGCRGEAACYGDQFDANVGSLEPDIVAPITAEAWLAGRDPGMDAVSRDLASRYP